MLKNYKGLIVWKKAYGLCLSVYKITEKFPSTEKYGLVSQMRRCSVSIVSNIAEGYQRQYSGEYIQFLYISFGACAELETQIMLSKDLKFIASEDCEAILSVLTEIEKMLSSLLRKIKERGGNL